MNVAPARSVRIAVPAYSGDLTAETKASVFEGVRAISSAGVDIEEFDVLPGVCYLDHARNILVNRFLKGSATDLIFIDADVGFDPESLLALCRVEHPVVAGIYPKKTDKPEWPVLTYPGELIAYNNMIEVVMAPTGFLRINRAVFEALDVPAYDNPDGPMRAFFKTDIRDGYYWGEDVEFCRLLREAGIPIKAFADMDFRHVDSKGRIFPGNWGKWLLSQREAA